MKAIKVETDAGQVIYIEIFDEITPTAGGAAGGTIAGGDKMGERLEKLKEVGTAIADVCRTLQDQIQSALDKSKPSELTLEFGVKLAGEMGIPLVTKGSSEGTFQVTAKWNFK